MKGTWTVEEFRDWCIALGINDPEGFGFGSRAYPQ